MEHKSKIYITFDQFSIPSCTLWARVAICHLSPNRSLKVNAPHVSDTFYQMFVNFGPMPILLSRNITYLCSDIFIWPMQIWMTLEKRTPCVTHFCGMLFCQVVYAFYFQIFFFKFSKTWPKKSPPLISDPR